MGARNVSEPHQVAGLGSFSIEHIDHDASKRRPYKKDPSRAFSPELILGRKHDFSLDRPLPPLPKGYGRDSELQRASSDLASSMNDELHNARLRPNLTLNTQVGPVRPRPRAVSDPQSATDAKAIELPGSFAPAKPAGFRLQANSRSRPAGLGLTLKGHDRHGSYSNIISEEMETSFQEPRRVSSHSLDNQCRLTEPFESFPDISFLSGGPPQHRDSEQLSPTTQPSKPMVPPEPSPGMVSDVSRLTPNLSMGADQRSLDFRSPVPTPLLSARSYGDDQKSVRSRSPLPTPRSKFGSHDHNSAISLSTVGDPFRYDSIDDSFQVMTATSVQSQMLSPRLVQGGQYNHISELRSSKGPRKPAALEPVGEAVSLPVFFDDAADEQPPKRSGPFQDFLRPPSSHGSEPKSPSSVYGSVYGDQRYSGAPSTLGPKNSVRRPGLPLDYSDCVVRSNTMLFRQSTRVFEEAADEVPPLPESHHIEQMHGTKLLERAETDLIKSVLNEYFDEATPASAYPKSRLSDMLLSSETGPRKGAQSDLFIDIDDMISSINRAPAAQNAPGITLLSEENQHFKSPPSSAASTGPPSVFSNQDSLSTNTSRQSSLKSAKSEESEKQSLDMQKVMDSMRRASRRTRRATISSPEDTAPSVMHMFPDPPGSRTQPPSRQNTPQLESRNALRVAPLSSSEPSLVRQLDTAASSVSGSNRDAASALDEPDARIRRLEAYVAATSVSMGELQKENDTLRRDVAQKKHVNTHPKCGVPEMNYLEARVDRLEQEKHRLNNAMAFGIRDQVRDAVASQPSASTHRQAFERSESPDLKSDRLEQENTALVNLVSRLVQSLKEETDKTKAAEDENDRLRLAMLAVPNELNQKRMT